MDITAIEILNQHRLMAIATLRRDGWPQTTLVGFGNDGLSLFFIISKRSQKFANIALDNRVSIAVGRDAEDPAAIKALSMSARVYEQTMPEQRQKGFSILLQRRPELSGFPLPPREAAAVMVARPEVISIVDYSKGLGHSDGLTLGPNGVAFMTPAEPDDWGLLPLRPTAPSDA